MPRDNSIQYELHRKSQWTDLSIEQLQWFQELNLSGFQMRVFIALKTYCWTDNRCFPSLDSIADRLGMTNKARRQQICNALKKLESCTLIKRKSKSSKPDRFTLAMSKSISVINDTQSSEYKDTNLNEDSTPLNPPNDLGGDIDNLTQSISQKQTRRVANRRKRMRKRDRLRVQEVAQRNEAEKVQRREMLATAIERTEKAPIAIQSMLLEHKSENPSNDEKGQIRQFVRATMLVMSGILNEKLYRPPYLTKFSQISEHEEWFWDLGLNPMAVWQWIKHNT